MMKIPRTATVALSTLALTIPSTAAALAATVPGSSVATVVTATWSPTSPDPSGVVYIPKTGSLLVSDAEVDEMPLYQGSNLYEATLQGDGSGSGTTLPWSNEPTGVAYNAASDHLYFSDDDKKSVFIVKGSGADGHYGTADDGPRTDFKTSTFGNTDPEDVAYDSKRDQLLFVDGLGGKWFTLTKGANGVFDGVSPGGDDVAAEFDLVALGAKDPEGIAYDAARDTVLVLDGSANRIFELDHNGSLLNEIDLSGLGIVKGAGLTLAPASTGSGTHYYIADRGLDNNSHPEENDGLIHEVSATLEPIDNRPPSANAGQDQLLDVPETATLVGSATDDGRPNDALTHTWSKVSGPGTVTFGSPSALTTTATFSAAGTYVVRLTASDGELSDSDDATISVYEPLAIRTVTLPITHGADDAQEGGGSSGTFVDLSSGDNELGNDGPPTPDQMLTGLRFVDLPVPAGGRVVDARIQFQVDEAGDEPANYTIRGEAADDASQFVRQAGNISARPTTSASVGWAPPTWDIIGAAGPDQRTPDLSSILQEIVDRPGWQQGNAAVFMIDGTGRRTAEAKDGLAPPVLVLDFRTSGGGTTTPPVVDAGADATVTLPGSAALDASVSRDATPVDATTTWSQVSGPGTATFEDAAALSTTATFSEAGQYTLRLTATVDGQDYTDDLVVTVEAAAASDPVVDAGADATVTLPGSAALDASVSRDATPVDATTTWSQVSGPGTATFEDAAALSTTATFSEAGQYTLRLTATVDGQDYTDDLVVTVEAAPAGPTVTDRSPEPDATEVPRSADVVVTFSTPVQGANWRTVQFYRVSNGRRTWGRVTYDSAARQVTLNPNNDLLAGEEYEVRITSGITDAAGHGVDPESWNFTAAGGTPAPSPGDEAGPTITDRSPEPDATEVPRSADVVVTFSTPVQGANWRTVQFYRVSNGRRTWGRVTYDSAARQVTLNPNNDLLAGEEYEVRITSGITDAAGHGVDPESWNFTAAGGTPAPSPGDEAGPTITDRSPEPDATEVPRSADVVVTFSTPVQGANWRTVQFYRVSNGRRTWGRVTYDPAARQVTLNPNNDLLAGEEYEVRITSGITDAAGHGVDPERWNFTAAGGTSAPSPRNAGDAIAPLVVSQSPEQDAGWVHRGANVIATFSEPVTGVNGTTFTLRRENGDEIPARVSYNATSRRATLNPRRWLPPRTLLTVEVTNGVRDLAGNAVEEASWAFMTRR